MIAKMINENNSGNGNDKNGMLTSSELAQMLNVHINTIRRWNDLGFIKAYRVGSRGDRRFSREEIDRFLEQGRELYQRVS